MHNDNEFNAALKNFLTDNDTYLSRDTIDRNNYGAVTPSRRASRTLEEQENALFTRSYDVPRTDEAQAIFTWTLLNTNLLTRED
jgi:hypothetical protein